MKITLIQAIIAAATVASSGSKLFEKCLRPCESPGRSKVCTFEFFVSKIAGLEKSTLAWRVINGTSPGPAIEICIGDTIEVIVENGLSSEELSFHWHGLRQKGSPHMDGVTMISQCPIMPYTSFRYVVKPESTGTYFYHAHSVRQQGDGLYGPLIVRGPQDNSSVERILVVSARSSGPLTEFLDLERPLGPRAIVLNGRTEDVIVEIERGKKYLLRLINANVFDCPVSFSIAGHDLEVVATDGRSVDSDGPAKRIIIFPGERFDVAITADEKPDGKYPIRFRGFQDCRGLLHEAFLDYRDVDEAADDFIRDSSIRDEESRVERDDEEILSDGSPCDVRVDSPGTVCSLHLRRNSSISHDDDDDDDQHEAVETFYVSFDVNTYEDVEDDMTDYSFNIYEFSYYPSYLSVTRKPTPFGQINGMTFEYPPSPILSQPEAVPEDSLCSVEEPSSHCNQGQGLTFCRCTQILRVPSNTIVDVVLIDEGFGGNVSHTFHVHGYEVKVIGAGRFDSATSKDEIVEMDKQGSLDRNDPATAPRKDTFVVPNKGYLVLRFRTDNIGYWLWEARSSALYLGNKGQPPMQFVMLVGHRENLPTVPIDFPTCGNLKSPASIFHDTD